MEKFAERLRELRTEMGLSQAKLAKAIGVSHTAVIFWETMQRVPNAAVIISLAEFFGVSADYLLGLKD